MDIRYKYKLNTRTVKGMVYVEELFLYDEDCFLE